MEEGAKMAKKVTVIIPALNEEESIAEVIDEVLNTGLKEQGYDLQIKVIDGRSTDKTVEIARERGASVFVQKGKGKGVGIRQAIELCSPKHVVDRILSLSSGSCGYIFEIVSLLDTDYVVMLDADGTYPPKYIPTMLESLESGNDVVSGSRFKGTIEEGAMSRMNRVGNKILSALASILYSHECSDICTGMWAFRSEALRSLELESNHFELEAELFAESVKKGLRISEVPINYLPRKGTTKLIPVSAGISILLMIIKRRFINANGEIRVKSENKEISAKSTRSG